MCSISSETVDQTADSDGLDLEKLGERPLVQSFLDIDLLEDLPLRPGQAGAADVLFEALAQQARRVDQQEADRCVFGFHGQKLGLRYILSKLIISPANVSTTMKYLHASLP